MSEGTLSTFDSEVRDNKLCKSFEKGSREFSLSKILIGLMKESHKTIRSPTHEVRLSTSFIQKARSSKQTDLKYLPSTMVEACGYHLCWERVKNGLNFSDHQTPNKSDEEG